jgi:two-component system, OmpR family, sensor histidine kinase KdpD
VAADTTACIERHEISPNRVPADPAAAINRGSTAQPPARNDELRILATVAHELRGPLTALTAAADILSEDFLRLSTTQVSDMLAVMHRRAVWLQGLVENLLCAAAIREGRLQLHQESLSLTELLADVDAVVGPFLAQHGQCLRVRMAGVLPVVRADTRRIGQVLVNLILNASKFGPDNARIDVTMSGGTDALRLAVADRGPGVAAEQTNRLFDPYYRAPATGVGGHDGVGLGLSIVKSIVEAHGGVVGVQNRRGGGARFWFTIPADPFTADAVAYARR